MLVKFVRFFRGYVDFSARGKFPERFLNITSRYGINLWDAHPSDDGLKGSMYVCDYRNIRQIARKAKVSLSINRRHGMPFILKRYKLRLGIPAGAFAGLIFIFILSNFIWSLSVTGNQTVSETYLREVLAENGVSVGAYKNSIDVEKVERNIQLQVSEIGWMSINITGSVASVEIKENAKKPELNTDTTPCNLKAKCDGVITKINVRSGVTEVLKGSGVAKGDLLVSGISEGSSQKVDTLTYLRASGEIYADVISQKELSIPSEYNYYSLTDNKIERKQLSFLWLQLPADISFDLFDDFTRDYRSSLFCMNDTVLPIGFKTQTDYELTGENVTVDIETAQKIFENESLLYELFESTDSTIVSRTFDITETDGEYSCTVGYVFNENIAESVDFSVTE